MTRVPDHAPLLAAAAVHQAVEPKALGRLGRGALHAKQLSGVSEGLAGVELYF